MATCLCEPADILIFPCSGASNCGQVTNEVALRLRERGLGTMYCTAGVGGHVSGLVEGARQARMLIAIDGCPVSCANKCLEQVKLDPRVHIVVSEALKLKKGYERPEEKDILAAYDLAVVSVKKEQGR